MSKVATKDDIREFVALARELTAKHGFVSETKAKKGAVAGQKLRKLMIGHHMLVKVPHNNQITGYAWAYPQGASDPHTVEALWRLYKQITPSVDKPPVNKTSGTIARLNRIEELLEKILKLIEPEPDDLVLMVRGNGKDHEETRA